MKTTDDYNYKEGNDAFVSDIKDKKERALCRAAVRRRRKKGEDERGINTYLHVIWRLEFEYRHGRPSSLDLMSF